MDLSIKIQTNHPILLEITPNTQTEESEPAISLTITCYGTFLF